MKNSSPEEHEHLKVTPSQLLGFFTSIKHDHVVRGGGKIFFGLSGISTTFYKTLNY